MSKMRERRLQSGLTQAELAARASVSRQLVAAVEAGRHAPAVDAALRLARALGGTVEELFGASPPAAVGAVADRLDDGTLVRVGRVGDALVAAELPDHGVAGEGWANPDGIAADGDVELFPGANPAGVVAAGCDPALGVAERLLDGLGNRSLMAVSAPTGSALEALARERVHAAVVHGVESELPPAPVAVARWHLARWQVGLGVSPSLKLGTVDDVMTAGVPVARRVPAASSQRALERAQAAAGFGSSPGPLASGHIEAARLAALLGGAGVTIEAAARAFELRFLPLEEHVVELWVAERWVGQPGVQALLELLAAPAFTRRVGRYGGYDLTGCGSPVTAA